MPAPKRQEPYNTSDHHPQSLCDFVDSRRLNISNSLVVCAGTVTCKSVQEMGSGFVLFKKLFSDKPNVPWVKKVNDILETDKKLPLYVEFDQQTRPKDGNGNLGGIATVPIYSSTQNNDEAYSSAIKQAIMDAKNNELPLFIQPLGIGVYGWSPQKAAQLFAKIIKEEEYPVRLLIFNQDKGSPDQEFKNALQSYMKNKSPELDVRANPIANPALANTYPYQFTRRFHLFTASTDLLPRNLKEKYQNYSGDELKSEILYEFRNQIALTKTSAELDDLKNLLKQTSEYKILATAQGLFTAVFSRWKKTSSIEAFEKMCKDQEDYIQTCNQHDLNP